MYKLWERIHAKWHKLYKRIHPKWHTFCSDSDHSLIRREIAKERREIFFLGISAGIQASQVPRVLVFTRPQYLQRQQCQPRWVANWANVRNCIARNQESWRLKISIWIAKNCDNYSPLKKNAMQCSSSILFDSFLEDVKDKSCPQLLKKNNVRHC